MRVRSLRIVAAGFAALLHAQSVLADEKAVVIDPVKVRLASVKFATCIVSKQRLKVIAIRFLLNGQESDGRLIASSNCFISATLDNGINPDGLTARWKVGAFRSLIASGLLRTEFKDKGPNDFTSVSPLSDLQAAKNEYATQDLLESAQILSKLGECATRRDPDAIRRMAQTDVQSPEELAAVRNLAPLFGECMYSGTSLKLTRELMRDNAVLAYARMAYTLQSVEPALNSAKAKN
jgi:hypothetical protein